MKENEAIKRVEEFGMYHAIGDLPNSALTVKAFETAIEALQEIQQYRSIGTVEECQKARERQRGKKPILCMDEVSGMFVDYTDGHGEYKTQMNNWWRCPCCNEVVSQRVIAHKHIHDQRKKKFCEKCGQAILWESDTP